MCCKGYLATHYRHNNRLFYLLIQYVSKAYRNEVLRLACVSQPAWEMYIQAFEAFENGKLKGQKLTRKQLMTKPEIKQTQFQSLLPLQEAKQVELLQKLVSKEITLKELKQTAAKEKRMGDVKEKFLHLTNCNKWEEAEERFLQHATDKALEQFVTLDFTKETPHVFSHFCASAVKWQSSSEIELITTTQVLGNYIIEAGTMASFDPAIVNSRIPGFKGASLFINYMDQVSTMYNEVTSTVNLLFIYIVIHIGNNCRCLPPNGFHCLSNKCH